MAAPFIPRPLTGPRPNIRTGSSIIFTIHPDIRLIIVKVIFPTA